MPDSSSTYTLKTDISYLENAEYTPFKSISKDLVVAKDLRASMSDVLRALDELDSRNSPEVRSAKKIIQRMLGCDAKTRQAVEKNIHSVLSAINLVLKVDSDTSQIRATMYEILKCLESRYYFAD